MSLKRIASLDGRRLVRARGLWIATILFAFVLALGTTIPWAVLDDPTPSTGTAYLLGPAVDLGLPALAVILTYASIAGLYRDGRIKVLLAPPVARHEILSGLVLARILCLWSISLIGIGVGVLTIVLFYGVPPVGPILFFTCVTLLAGASYTTIGIAVSVLVGRPIRSIAVLLVGLLFVHAIWTPLYQGVTQLILGDDSIRWVDYGILLSPTEAYSTIANGLLPASPHLDMVVAEGEVSADAGDLVGGTIELGELLVAVAVLVGWMVAGMLVASVTIRRCEIE